MAKEIHFDLFRFQILPKRTTQLTLFDMPIALEELKQKKNDLFFQALFEEKNTYLNSYQEELKHKIVLFDSEIIVMKLGKRKNILLTNENLDEEEHEDFPSVYVILNNNPDNQKVAISRDEDAFSNSFVVANILESNFSKFCDKFNLEVVVNPILNKTDFWELISKYEGRITQLKFNLIRPNMANISGTFKDEIRELTDTTNSLITKVELNAPKESTLENINQNNDRVKALADYAIQGGSQYIHMKAKGIKRVIKTEQTISTFTIDSLDISGTPENVLNTFKEITND